jgi:hypothetical protein
MSFLDRNFRLETSHSRDEWTAMKREFKKYTRCAYTWYLFKRSKCGPSQSCSMEDTVDQSLSHKADHLNLICMYLWICRVFCSLVSMFKRKITPFHYVNRLLRIICWNICNKKQDMYKRVHSTIIIQRDLYKMWQS